MINLTIDTEVLIDISKLDINKSALVNNFFKEYCKAPTEDTENLVLDSLKSRIKELEEQKKTPEKKRLIL